MGDRKEADPATRLEIDTWILDYTIFKATKACLDERNAARDGLTLPPSANPDLPLAMVDAFLVYFKAKYPPHAAPAALRSRLRLARFVSLFTRRSRPPQSSSHIGNLQHLHRVNKTRVEARKTVIPSDFDQSLQISKALPLSKEQLKHHRQNICSSLKIRGVDVDGSIPSPSITMRELLPDFISLSAHLYKDFDWEIKKPWLELVAEFMLQAVLEQYLVCGAGSTRVLRECFSYGWDPSFGKDRMSKYQDSCRTLGDQTYYDVYDDEETINNMFYDENNDAEIEGWKDIREHFLEFFKPAVEMDFVRQLELTVAQHPIFTFEGRVMFFLGQLLKAQATPILVQLEEGKLEGMSAEETAQLKEKAGLLL